MSTVCPTQKPHQNGPQAHVSLGVNAAELNRKVNAAIQKVGSDWDNLPENHALLKFSAKLGELIQEAGYNEMYGVELSAPTEEYISPPTSPQQSNVLTQTQTEEKQHPSAPSSSSKSSSAQTKAKSTKQANSYSEH